jgi:hypothetical protein
MIYYNDFNMQKTLLLFFIFFINSLTYSQIGGKYVYQFLNLVTSPRQAALGGKAITIYGDDVNQVLFNPATINADMNNHLALNYSNYFGDVTYGTASYVYTYDRHVQTFHVGVNYVNYGEFDGYDEYGEATSSFSGSEMALSFGYAYNVPYTTLFIGASGKLISSKLENYTSYGAATDIGAIYIDEVNDVNWALVFRNLGTQLTTYSGTIEKLPFTIMAGVSQELENVPIRWHFTFDNIQQWDLSFINTNQVEESLDGTTSGGTVTFFGNVMRHVIIGAELFPERSFNVRFGYNFRRAAELLVVDQRNFSGISVGFGLKMNKLKFDYSYSKYTLASNTSMFGLTINLQ